MNGMGDKRINALFGRSASFRSKVINPLVDKIMKEQPCISLEKLEEAVRTERGAACRQTLQARYYYNRRRFGTM